jgi:hypothetical protein
MSFIGEMITHKIRARILEALKQGGGRRRIMTGETLNEINEKRLISLIPHFILTLNWNILVGTMGSQCSLSSAAEVEAGHLKT